MERLCLNGSQALRQGDKDVLGRVLLQFSGSHALQDGRHGAVDAYVFYFWNKNKTRLLIGGNVVETDFRYFDVLDHIPLPIRMERLIVAGMTRLETDRARVGVDHSLFIRQDRNNRNNRNSNAMSLDWLRMELIAIRLVSSLAANTTVVNTFGIGRHWKDRKDRKVWKDRRRKSQINFVCEINFFQIFTQDVRRVN